MPGPKVRIPTRTTTPGPTTTEEPCGAAHPGTSSRLVADDDLGADADDPLPRDHGMAVHLRLTRAAAAVRADAEALEKAELPAREPGHPQAAVASSPRMSWMRPSAARTRSRPCG